MKDAAKLDRLLDLRRHEEERRLVDLALARQAVAHAEEALRRLREQRADIEVAIAGAVGESVGDVQTRRLLLEQLDRSINNAGTVAALASATATENEHRYEEARRHREALERVVGPRHERAEETKRITERAQEDEMALTRFRTPRQAS